MFSRNQIIAVSAASVTLLLAGCEKAGEGSFEDRVAQSAMDAVNATGAPVCVDPGVSALAIETIMSNIDKGPALMPSADLANFESSLTPQFDTVSTTLKGVNAELKQTSCDATLIFKGFENDIRMPITFAAQPNAAGDGYVVNVEGLGGVSEAYRAAKQQYYFDIVYPRQSAAYFENEEAERQARNAEYQAQQQRYEAEDAAMTANQAEAELPPPPPPAKREAKEPVEKTPDAPAASH